VLALDIEGWSGGEIPMEYWGKGDKKKKEGETPSEKKRSALTGGAGKSKGFGKKGAGYTKMNLFDWLPGKGASKEKKKPQKKNNIWV